MNKVTSTIILALIASFNLFAQHQLDVSIIASAEGDAAILGYAVPPQSNPPSYTAGVIGVANTANGIGVYGQGTTAIRGDQNPENGIFAGYFLGNVQVTGSFDNPSDRKLKNILKNSNEALPLILQLKPTTYKYKTSVFPDLNLREGIQTGFIAQEVEEIFPHMVSESFKPESYNRQGELVSDRVDYKTVNYLDLIPVLTQGLQELSAIVDRQNIIIEKQRIQLEAIVSELSNLKNEK